MFVFMCVVVVCVVVVLYCVCIYCLMAISVVCDIFCFFFRIAMVTTEIYSLSLHDDLAI